MTLHEYLKTYFKDKNSHTRIFTNIYFYNKWGKWSGPGSSLEYNKEYIEFLESWINAHKIESVVDLGCGDWRFSSSLFGKININYLGIDCVFFLIERNKSIYSNTHVNFLCADILREIDIFPSADLYIAKDIFQHWSDQEVKDFLKMWKKKNKSKFLIIVNDFKNKGFKAIKDGGARALPCTHDAYRDMNISLLMRYRDKEVCLCSQE